MNKEIKYLKKTDRTNALARSTSASECIRQSCKQQTLTSLSLFPAQSLKESCKVYIATGTTVT